jgi:hypothetical protein
VADAVGDFAGKAGDKMGGPVPAVTAVVGALAATVGGWWAMHAGSDTGTQLGEEDERHYRSHFETHPRATQGMTYEHARTGYALGHTASGVMGTDDGLVEEVRQAGERAGERVWPLPLWDEYRDLMKSDIADVKNAGGRPAGSISAGWFLREFVDGFAWAHLDIAGTAYTDRDDPARVKGPTGIGVRLFSEFLLGRSAGGTA